MLVASPKIMIQKCTCNSCGCDVKGMGHLCSPLKNEKVYECVGCGLISLNKELLCKPRLLRIK